MTVRHEQKELEYQQLARKAVIAHRRQEVWASKQNSSGEIASDDLTLKEMACSMESLVEEEESEPYLCIKNTFYDVVVPSLAMKPRRSKSMPHSRPEEVCAEVADEAVSAYQHCHQAGVGALPAACSSKAENSGEEVWSDVESTRSSSGSSSAASRQAPGIATPTVADKNLEAELKSDTPLSSQSPWQTRVVMPAGSVFMQMSTCQVVGLMVPSSFCSSLPPFQAQSNVGDASAGHREEQDQQAREPLQQEKTSRRKKQGKKQQQQQQEEELEREAEQVSKRQHEPQKPLSPSGVKDADAGKKRQMPQASETDALSLISDACTAFVENSQSPVWALCSADGPSSALVQKAIEMVADELWMARSSASVDREAAMQRASFRLTAILSGLHGQVLSAIEHPHANYVLQKAADVLPLEHLAFIIEELRGNAFMTSKHRFACRTMIRLVPHGRSPGSVGAMVSALVDELLEHAHELSCDMYGNYVMQEILEHGSDHQRRVLCEALRGHIAPVVRTQHGSRVVEKVLKVCSDEEMDPLVSSLLMDIELLEFLMAVDHGYLVLKPLLKSERYQRRTATLLRPMTDVLHRTRQGKRLLGRVLGNSDPPMTAVMA